MPKDSEKTESGFSWLRLWLYKAYCWASRTRTIATTPREMELERNFRKKLAKLAKQFQAEKDELIARISASSDLTSKLDGDLKNERFSRREDTKAFDAQKAEWSREKELLETKIELLNHEIKLHSELDARLTKRIQAETAAFAARAPGDE